MMRLGPLQMVASACGTDFSNSRSVVSLPSSLPSPPGRREVEDTARSWDTGRSQTRPAHHWGSPTGVTRHGRLTTRGRAQTWCSLFIAPCASLYLPGCPQPPMAMPWQSPAGQWSSWLIGLQRDKHGLARRSMRERMVAWGQSPTDGVDRVKPGRANAGGWLDRGPSLHGSYRLACSV